jgi:type II secretory ATPase GspE/PulE/Tfp pilus assembly ATPase PilB-like protein
MSGESVVMRILDRATLILDLEEIGFSPSTLRKFEALIRRPYGIILVTGPTGSGKTTTLYAALEKINTPDKKIITIEDPIEYHMEGVNQIQVKPWRGLTKYRLNLPSGCPSPTGFGQSCGRTLTSYWSGRSEIPRRQRLPSSRP